MQKDNMFVAQLPQADDPGRAAIAKLVANVFLGIILKYDHGCLVLRQCPGVGHQIVVALFVRGGRLKRPGGLAVKGLDHQSGAVGVVKRSRRRRAGGQENGSDRQSQ